jgi:hypothetical protein
MPGDDPGVVPHARPKKLRVASHDKLALSLGGLMTPLAVLLENGPNMSVIADLLGLLLFLLVLVLLSALKVWLSQRRGETGEDQASGEGHGIS